MGGGGGGGDDGGASGDDDLVSVDERDADDADEGAGPRSGGGGSAKGKAKGKAAKTPKAAAAAGEGGEDAVAGPSDGEADVNAPLPGCPSVSRLLVRLTRFLSAVPSIYPTPLQSAAIATAAAANAAAASLASGQEGVNASSVAALEQAAAEAAAAANAAMPQAPDAPFLFSMPKEMMARTGPTRATVQAAADLGISTALYASECDAAVAVWPRCTSVPCVRVRVQSSRRQASTPRLAPGHKRRLRAQTRLCWRGRCVGRWGWGERSYPPRTSTAGAPSPRHSSRAARPSRRGGSPAAGGAPSQQQQRRLLMKARPRCLASPGRPSLRP